MTKREKYDILASAIELLDSEGYRVPKWLYDARRKFYVNKLTSDIKREIARKRRDY